MIINRLRSCLLALTLFAAFSACSNSSPSTHHDDGGSGVERNSQKRGVPIAPRAIDPYGQG
jgi:hypothetical protein